MDDVFLHKFVQFGFSWHCDVILDMVPLRLAAAETSVQAECSPSDEERVAMRGRLAEVIRSFREVRCRVLNVKISFTKRVL